jgi:hypothetical protein
MIPQELMSGVNNERSDERYNSRRNRGSNTSDTNDRRDNFDAPKTAAETRRGRKVKTWRNHLRPRYIQFTKTKIRVNPKAASYSTQATMSSCGAPPYEESYVLTINEGTLYDAEHHKNNRKGYKIDAFTQHEMFRDYFRNKVHSGIYAITAEIRNRPVLQTINTLLMHAIQSRGAKRVQWRPVYATGYEGRDKFQVQEILVLDNIHDNMDNVKFSLLRDLLHKHRDSVVFLLIDGYDPLEFTMRHLHVNPRMVLNIGYSRIPQYIRRI